MSLEQIDILDENGNFTGIVKSREEVHKKGLWHATVHIWLVNETKILFQKRAKHKETFPNKLDVSVAGHISNGQTPITAAIREIQEEIGIIVLPQQLKLLCIQKEIKTFGNGILDNEFNYIYLLKTNLQENQFKVDTNEVQYVKYIPMDILEQKVVYNQNKFVTDISYYKKIIKMIKQVL